MVTKDELQEWEEMSAFVKANGYTKLDSHKKRLRYRELKEKVLGEAEKKHEELSEERGEEPVIKEQSVPLSKVQDMIDKAIRTYKREATTAFEQVEGMEEIAQIGKWIKAKKPKEQNHTAKLRVFREDGVSDGGIIIDWRFLKNEVDENTRMRNVPIYRIKVLYDGGKEKEYDIPLLEMVQITEFETVEIIKEEVEDLQLSQGKGRKAYTKSGYAYSSPGMFGVKDQGLGEEFDYIAVKNEYTVTVKRPNGETLTLNSTRLN